MDKMADVLGRAGAWCGQNKYLSAIKNAFQNFMPLTIAGAIGVLWCNGLVNDQTGLGLFFKPIMALDFLNPAFQAVNFCTISCITVGITLGIAQEIGVWNMGAERAGYIPGLVGLAAWLSVTNTSHVLKGAKEAFTGIAGNELGDTGLFTGMIIGVLSVELFCFFEKQDALKIKMPEQVPPGVARAFEVLIPTCLTAIIIGAIGLVCQLATGAELNALIFNVVQKPLQSLIGNNIFAVAILYVIISLFWCVGIHGSNMVNAVKEPIFRPLLYANTAAFTAGAAQKDIPYVMNLTMLSMFGEFGGSGVTIGLVIAIFIFSRREDNRTIAGISVVPALFNINETMTFGIPLVLNPILDIPFILAPVVTLVVGYLLVSSGFCPKIVLEVPWTMPPVILGFLATGGSPMGAISQLIVVAISVVVYVPFLIAYEKFQAKQAAE